MNHEEASIQDQHTIEARQRTGNQAVEVYQQETAIGDPASVSELKNQVSVIQQAMEAVMKSDEHYGVIPGTQGKPSLLKPGAEKLSLLFRLSPTYNVSKTDLGRGHREYEVVCTLTHITSGNTMGQGVGSCNTMESKYRYRTESTGQEVPKEYWENRDPELIGGKAYSPRKKDGKWLIYQKVEHDNPADYFNTVLKMAKKRAHVDAILTATAASDIFTQDVEDMDITPQNTEKPKQDAKPAQSQQPKQQPQQNKAQSTDKPWLNETPKGSDEITKEWKEVVNKLVSGEWAMGHVLDRYKLSKANRAKLESVVKGEQQPPSQEVQQGAQDDLPF